MNDAGSVGGVERVSYFDGEGERGVEIDGATRDPQAKSDASEEFHGAEGMPFGLTDFVNGADVLGDSALKQPWLHGENG
jgi:hypothetical protein